MHDEMTNHCLNCGRSEMEIPLVVLRYQREQNWICSGCLPVLIHHPERLVGKISTAASIEAFPTDADDH